MNIETCLECDDEWTELFPVCVGGPILVMYLSLSDLTLFFLNRVLLWIICSATLCLFLNMNPNPPRGIHIRFLWFVMDVCTSVYCVCIHVKVLHAWGFHIWAMINLKVAKTFFHHLSNVCAHKAVHKYRQKQLRYPPKILIASIKFPAINDNNKT